MPENSARRNFDPEQVVIDWIEQVDPVPTTLAEAVKKYRILTALYEYAERNAIDTAEVSRRMNRLYDSLIESAAEYLEHQATARGVKPDKQLRRLQRKAESRMTWMERCTQAINEWRAERAVGGAR